MRRTCAICNNVHEDEGVYFDEYEICEFCLADPEKDATIRRHRDEVDTEPVRELWDPLYSEEEMEEIVESSRLDDEAEWLRRQA